MTFIFEGIQKGPKIRIQVAKNRDQDGSNREGNGGREYSALVSEITLDGAACSLQICNILKITQTVSRWKSYKSEHK